MFYGYVGSRVAGVCVLLQCLREEDGVLEKGLSLIPEVMLLLLLLFIHYTCNCHSIILNLWSKSIHRVDRVVPMIPSLCQNPSIS